MSQKLCKLSELSATGCKAVVCSLDGGATRTEILITEHDYQPVAYINECPHLGTPLQMRQDVFLDMTGDYIQCSTHGALFRKQDGYCVAGPCKKQSLQKVMVYNERSKVVLP